MVDFTPVPQIRPRPCTGCLMDIPAGRYHIGKHGDSILNGGFSNFIGIGGRGNTFKTALAMALSFIVLNRYKEADFLEYDAEMTATWDRLEDTAQRYENINYHQMVDDKRILLTSHLEHSGEEFWEMTREISKNRAENSKKLMLPTPFLDKAGFPIVAFPPSIKLVDSLSEFKTSSMETLQDNNMIDASGMNTDHLRAGGVKTRMVMQVPSVSVAGGINFIMTAHIGNEFKLDQYAPSSKTLSFMKNGLEFKYVPKKFTFLTSHCWFVNSADPLRNKTTKAAEYPLKGFNELDGDTDLMELTIINIRSKTGPTGHAFTLLISQTEGLLTSLSEFHYLKSRKDKFGLGGNDQTRFLEIYPEVQLKRTTVRELVDEDKKLQRALEITSEMAQIYDYWPDFPKEDRVDPKALYERLKEYGYDWNVLLETRGYWTFDHYTNAVPPLSTMDLINMYHGRYVPFWYPDKDTLKIPKQA